MTVVGPTMAGRTVGRFLGDLGRMTGIGAQSGEHAEADDGARDHHPGQCHPGLGLS
jgi:hypothetical protein